MSKNVERKRIGFYESAWHYKYYLNLRKIWCFIEGEEEEAKSLCKYAWTIVFLSLCTLIFGLGLAFGWLFLKGNRALYTYLSKSKFFNKYFLFLDDNTRYGEVIQNMSEDIKEGSKSPGLVLLASFLLWGFIAFVVLGFIGLFGFGLWMFITNIFNLPWIIWQVIVVFWSIVICLGYWLFCIFSVFGLVMKTIYWAGYVVGHWLYILWILIITHLDVIGTTIGYALLGVFIVYLAIKIIMCDKMAGFRQFLVFKFNGFMEARKLMASKPRKEKKTKPKREITIHLNLREEVIKLLSVFGVFWEAIKGWYHGVCPMYQILPSPKPEKKQSKEVVPESEKPKSSESEKSFLELEKPESSEQEKPVIEESEEAVDNKTSDEAGTSQGEEKEE